MTDPGQAQHVVVAGASAGGVEALTAFVGGLPADLPAAVLITLHVPSDGVSRLPGILARHTSLPVRAARDGELPLAGHVYVAVNDRHLLLRNDRVLLSAGPRYNGWRPAVDPLFRSAARWYGPRAVGVVFSGALDDGAGGLAAVVAAGGAAVVQDPQDADFPAMPLAALAVVPEAISCTAAAVGSRLNAMLRDRPSTEPAEVMDPDLRWETDVMHTPAAGSNATVPGRPAGISCPDCSGGMNVVDRAAAVHYVCHVGHGWSPYALVAAQRVKVEQALWTAVSMLEEQASVHRAIAEQAERSNASILARRQSTAEKETMTAADTIRRAFLDLMPPEA